jgi:calcineurin-like phosphoesterase family protein
MDKKLIHNWNKVVGGQDTVFHLGDFGCPNIIDYLNGKEIVLIRGNHDTRNIIDRLLKNSRVRLGKTNEFFIPDKLFKMVHKPSRAKSQKCFYLYGHTHGFQIIKRNGLNIGVDSHNFTPLSFNEVLVWKTTILNHYSGDLAVKGVRSKCVLNAALQPN